MDKLKRAEKRTFKALNALKSALMDEMDLWIFEGGHSADAEFTELLEEFEVADTAIERYRNTGRCFG